MTRHQYVIVEFRASWCGLCHAEIPNLKKAYDKYKSKGLEIVSMSLDDKKEDYEVALKEENTPWINAIAGGAFNSQIAIDYGVSALPVSVLINKKGKIVAKNIELRDKFLDQNFTTIFRTIRFWKTCFN